MRYINIMLFILCINLNGEVYNIFSNGSDIYYSSLNSSENGFILNNSLMRNNNNFEISQIFKYSIVGSVNYSGVSYSKDIKFIEGVSGGKAVLLPNGKSFIKMDNRGYAYSRENSINSFTIEFYLNPYQIRMNSKVLSKISIHNNGDASEYSGVRASIIDGKLIWQFDNLFMYNGEYSNIILSAGESL